MQDRELYRQILGIQSPWYVKSVELNLEAGEVHVHLEHEEVNWKCSKCGKECRLYDHQPERRWRHLDTCQYRTILHAQIPRSDCEQDGPLQVKLPWAEPGSRFTMLMEAVVIEWLKYGSQKAVAKQLGLSWDEVHSVMRRAVKRGLERRQRRLVARLGIDEKSHRRGRGFFTLVNDLDRGCVLYVAETREQAALDGFWATLSTEQVQGIEAIALDMWDAYVKSIQKHVPDADQKMVYDKFHIAHHLSHAVDLVRRRENKSLLASGDDRLQGTRFDWLKKSERMSRKQRRAFARLRRSTLKTSRAWGLKEAAMKLFDYTYEGAARNHFQWWHRWAVRCRLRPMIQVAGMLKRRFENIITYLRHRITNAASESINAKIQWMKYTARGFRNMNNFIDAIYFHCGGLDLAPSPTQ